MAAPKLDPALTDVLRRVKEVLGARFGERLRGIYLYGSQARGDATEESDIDLMVLLEPPFQLLADIHSINDAIWSLQEEAGFMLQALPVPADLFARGEFAIYRTVRDEGIAL